eukprot:3387900-Pyramimonas_sp.AAC.1
MGRCVAGACVLRAAVELRADGDLPAASVAAQQRSPCNSPFYLSVVLWAADWPTNASARSCLARSNLAR